MPQSSLGRIVETVALTRHVRTPEGQSRFKEPIGAVIIQHLGHGSRAVQRHGLKGANARHYVVLISRARTAAQAGNRQAAGRHIRQATALLEKFHGDDVTMRYLRLILRKFLPNVPAPARRYTSASGKG